MRFMPALCSCFPESYCHPCRTRLLEQLSGAAANRGIDWARSVARRVRVDKPWPAFGGRCAEIALGLAKHMTRDRWLHEEFAKVVVEYAAAEWSKLRATWSAQAGPAAI